MEGDGAGRLQRVLVAVALALATALAAPAARAAPPRHHGGEGDALFRRGVAAAESGRWEEARDAFARSYEASPLPGTLLNLAGAEAQTGHVLAAAAHYRQLLEVPALKDKKRAAVRSALSAVEARAGHVTVHVDHPIAGDHVTLDGVATAWGGADQAFPLDPGSHVAALLRDGATKTSVSFRLADGETSTVTLAADATAPIAAAAAPAAPSEPDRSTPTSIASSSAPSASAPDAARDDRPWTKRLVGSPWFWVGAGVVVTGATIGIVCVATCSRQQTVSGNAGQVNVP